MNTIKIKLPQLVEVDDYHVFDVLKETFRTLSNQSVKVKELSTEHGIGRELLEKHGSVYIGVIYLGSFPDNNTLRKLDLNVV